MMDEFSQNSHSLSFEMFFLFTIQSHVFKPQGIFFWIKRRRKKLNLHEHTSTEDIIQKNARLSTIILFLYINQPRTPCIFFVYHQVILRY